MKKLLLLLLVIPILFGCNTPDPVATFSGTATNLENGFFILGLGGGATDSVFVDENNSFSLEVPEIDKTATYYIYFESNSLEFKVPPKKSVKLSFDKSDFPGSAKFSGDNANINNYLVTSKTNKNIKEGGPDVFSLPYAEYKAWADANLSAKNALLESTEKEDKTDKFWVTEEGNILFGWASDIALYPSYHKYYAKVEEVELPENYESYKDKLDLNNPAYLESGAFKAYIRNSVIEATKVEEDDDRFLATLETAAELISNKDVLDFFCVDYLKGQLSWTELSELENSIAYMKENVNDAELLADFNTEYEAWKTLAAGQPGFDFAGKDLEGNEVKFSDFKGKYVYVDVWATWCGPCIYEIPFLKKLEEDYHGRNIVFISYSIDDDRQAWLDFVPAEELGGVQIIGEDAWQSAMPQYYKVRGVPTFMFFDPEGKIISVKMTRPSNQATRDQFESYSDL